MRWLLIKVIKSGFYTSIQDQGRFGYQQFGVPVSGVMDSNAANMANNILGNNSGCAVLEITMTGPVLEFLCNTVISICGADISPKLNDKPLDLNRSVVITPHDVLSFGKLKQGFRAYIAVKGGIVSEMVMRSRCQYKNVTKADKIRNDDLLKIVEAIPKNNKGFSAVKYEPKYNIQKELEVYEGPEFHQLNKSEAERLLSQEFTISKLNNRMAYQLTELLENNLESIITSLVIPGTVQLTPSGQLIVLMHDCQTTGGYPRILQLSESAINTLSQKQTDQILRFRLNRLD